MFFRKSPCQTSIKKCSKNPSEADSLYGFLQNKVLSMYFETNKQKAKSYFETVCERNNSMFDSSINGAERHGMQSYNLQ